MRLFRFFVIIQIFLLNWVPGNGWANGLTETSPSSIEMQADTSLPPSPPEDYTAAFVKMLGALIGLLVLVFLVIWLIKSIARGRFLRHPSTPHIAIIERRALSPKSMLYLVEVDGARILIAESQLEVRPLYQGLITEEKK